MKRSVSSKKCILLSVACCTLLLANQLSASEQNRGKFGDIKAGRAMSTRPTGV